MSPQSTAVDRRATVHRPVMLAECVAALELRPGLTVLDGTVGGGGHSARIADAIGPTGRLIAADRDASMLARARECLGDPKHVRFVYSSYADIDEHPVVSELPIDRILVDLGLSSDQLADADRGFGFDTGGPLDMRFDTNGGRTVAEYLATTSAEAVAKDLKDFGDVSDAGRLASLIARRRSSVESVAQLLRAVESVCGPQQPGRSHPATRVMQALRIAVNDEFGHLRRALTKTFPKVLAPGGLLAVLTFHSIEDRIVKQALKNKHVWTQRQKKPMVPRPAEVRDNPRSRSAKLRVAERV